MAKKTQPASRWHNGTTPIEDLKPAEQLAHQIVSDYRDLTPSVQRIMDADLDDAQRHQALSAFQSSLGSVGDPNRDPRVAIASVTSSAHA